MHRPNLGRELQALGIPYQVFYVEDRPDLAEKFAIRHSPNLVVNDEVVFRRQPTEAELRDYFGR
jgi:hypothetical protein